LLLKKEKKSMSLQWIVGDIGLAFFFISAGCIIVYTGLCISGVADPPLENSFLKFVFKRLGVPITFFVVGIVLIIAAIFIK
jgi:hypothetical protein